MSDNKILNFQKLHHACLLVGDPRYWGELLETELKIFFKTENLSACPDVWWLAYDSFGIKDSHNLIEKEANRSFSGRGRFFVLEISSITPEAQNSLLKTLEEPVAGTHFFIITRNSETFLPTVRSRMQIFLPETSTQAKRVSAGVEFLKLDLPERLEFIQKEFLPARAGGKKSTSINKKDRTKSDIIDFIIDLERSLHDKIDLRKITKDEEISLRELEKAQRYLQNPRSSNRLILEHLALILPPVTSPPDLKLHVGLAGGASFLFL
jgi:hypothetical protein